MQLGLKTGSTSVALYNLSASATRDGLSLIAVIMKAPNTKVRFSCATKLLDYGFNNYSYKEFGKTGDTVKSLVVNRGVSNSVDAVLENSCGALVKKGDDKNLVQDIILDDSVVAPISKGQKLGEVNYSINGEVVGSSNIVAKSDVDKISLWNMTTFLYESWYRLIR